MFLLGAGLVTATSGGLENFLKKPVYIGPAPVPEPEGEVFVVISMACFSLATLSGAALINKLSEDPPYLVINKHQSEPSHLNMTSVLKI